MRCIFPFDLTIVLIHLLLCRYFMSYVVSSAYTHTRSTHIRRHVLYVCVCCVHKKKTWWNQKHFFGAELKRLRNVFFSSSSSSSSSYSYCCCCWLYIRQTWMLRRECGTRPPTCYFLIRNMLIYLFLNQIQNKRARFYFNSGDCWQPSNGSFLLCIQIHRP